MKVCIIGAGAAGLASARYGKEEGFECEVFEQSGKLGGTWNYTDYTDRDEYGLPIYTAMYENLKSNIPKECMAFDGFPYPKEIKESYISQPQVLDYLHNFTRHFNLTPLLKYFHRVESVKPTINNRWEVRIRQVLEKTEQTREFDAVMVCNGHNSTANYPSIPGMESFRGKQMHSFTYRKPEPFKNKKVLIIGVGPSGVDIAKQISSVANRVFLSQRRSTNLHLNSDKITETGQVVRIYENQVEVKDGSKFEVDVIMYATGYKYSFPFLSPECKIHVDNNWIKYLYKHVVNIEYPSMGFIGMAAMVAIIPLLDIQARFFLSLLKKRWSLPEKQEMINELLQRAEKHKTDGIPQNHFHTLFTASEREAYFEELAFIGKVKPIPKVVGKIHHHGRENRYANPLPNYRIIDDDNFEIIN